MLLLLLASPLAGAQEIEPRRWSQMPSGVNFVGVGVAYTFGDIFLDPLLGIEDGEFELGIVALSYIRSFGIAGRSARVDVLLPWATGRWEGHRGENLISTRRDGLFDPRFRLSVLLYGGPEQTAREFAATPQSNTVVGAAVALKLPLGDYFPDKLINLGANRWVLTPQLGVTHVRGEWTWELSGSVSIHGDNDEFLVDSELATDPLFALQGHVVYTFRPGLWASLSTAYGIGGDNHIDGGERASDVGNWLVSVSAGVPLSRTQGLKLSWVRGTTQRNTGADYDSLLLSWALMY